jgi:hypothetical protein
MTGSEDLGTARARRSRNLSGTDAPMVGEDPVSGLRHGSQNHAEPVPGLTVPRCPPRGGTRNQVAYGNPASVAHEPYKLGGVR